MFCWSEVPIALRSAPEPVICMQISLPPVLAAAVEGGLVETFGLDPKLIAFQLVGFLLFFGIVYKWGIKPIVARMDERNAVIASGLRYADEMKAKLAEAERQHQETLKRAAHEAQKIVDDARLAANELRDRELKKATTEAERRRTEAEADIAREKLKMLAEVREEITRLVVLTSSRVLARELSADERGRYSATAARELAGSGN
jgi:F-type H+-transporting ATPase subunit b